MTQVLRINYALLYLHSTFLKTECGVKLQNLAWLGLVLLGVNKIRGDALQFLPSLLIYPKIPTFSCSSLAK